MNEGDGTVMKDLAVGNVGPIDILWAPEHIRTRMPIKHELPLTVSTQRNKSKSRPGQRGEPYADGVHPIALQRVSQEVTELIIAHLTDEASTIAQSSHADCNVRRGTTRGFFECRSLSQAHSRFRRDKVNEHLTRGDYIHHSSLH